MSEWHIERLDRSHERRELNCGKTPLDEFLRTLVSQYEKRNLGRTYVAVRSGDKRVYGYYTLASGSVCFESVPPSTSRKLPKHPVPVVLLARLAVDRSVQGQGLGAVLLSDVLGRCLMLAESVGVHAVEVEAIDPSAQSFYEKYGFTALVDAPTHLFLPVATILRILGNT